MTSPSSANAAPVTRMRDRFAAKVSAVLPVFNEAAILEQLTAQLVSELGRNSREFEIIYVNDGSSDGSRELLDSIASRVKQVVVVHLARNFGHQPALHAGLDHVQGDVVITMDSDLQDDPRAISEFLSEWECGSDVVYARRFGRKESLPKRILFYSFYRVLNAIATTRIPQDAGNFGLMDIRVVRALQSLPERERYFPGLRNWTGFRQTGIPVERAARHDNQPRVSLAGLFRLAKTAVFSFSSFPLTFFYVIAALSALVCAGAIGFVLFHKLFTGLATPGWTSTIITGSFFGALNALGISILGEYVIRIFDEVRRRPVYVVDVVRQQSAAPGNSMSVPESQALQLLETIQHLQSVAGHSEESAQNSSVRNPRETYAESNVGR
ncbi:MAG: glycosyltransferase family 2 protein [Planctomycetaceae bacterium]|nr:glycosyltransferase family 2 protein [Planctomycetaceae bacterium]